MNNDYSRILGIDYGSVRIGLSLSDPLKIIAQGFKTILNNNQTVDEVVKIIAEQDVSKIVVGMPFTLNGAMGSKADEVERFITLLQEKISVDVVRYDERFTSVMAQKSIMTMGAKKKQRQNKAKIDEVASAILLQNYLDSLTTGL